MPDNVEAMRAPTPLHRPVAEDDIERALLANIDALLSGDLDQAAEQSKFFARHRLMAATSLAKLMIQDRLPVPGAGFHMIEALTFGYPESILRQIAHNQHSSDMTRFGAHRRLGWSVAKTPQDEAQLRREFMSTMREPFEMLAETAILVLDAWPSGLEIIDEIVRYLVILPPEERLSILQRIVEEAESRSIWLLHAMLNVDDPQTQLFVLRELARYRAPASAGPIYRMAQLTQSDQVRREAEATLQRLRLRAVDRVLQDITWELPPQGVVQASAVGLEGAQQIYLAFEGDQTPKLLIEFLIADDGVSDVTGRLLVLPFLDDEYDDDDAVAHLDDEPGDDEDSFEEAATDGFIDTAASRSFDGGLRNSSHMAIDPGVARGIISSALARQAETGKLLPPTFELWEPYLHATLPPPVDETVLQAELSSVVVHTQRFDQAAAETLMSHLAFSNWILPAERVLAAMEGVPAPSSKRWSLKQYRPLAERLFSEDEVELLRRSLLRQAWMLDLGQDSQERDLALQARETLGNASQGELAKHPLVRKVLQRSAEAALNPFRHGAYDDPFDSFDESDPF